MTKSEKIREYMRLAYAGGTYDSGIICRERAYAYRLVDGLQAGTIQRCPVTLLDAGCLVWDVWASDTAVIRALVDRKTAYLCNSASLDSLFHRGSTVSPWDVYVRDFGGVPIR